MPPDAIGPCAISENVDTGAHGGLDVQLVAVKLSGDRDTPRSQRLELLTHTVDAATGLRIGAKGRLRRARLRHAVQDTHMIGQVGAGAGVPFGIEGRA